LRAVAELDADARGRAEANVETDRGVVGRGGAELDAETELGANRAGWLGSEHRGRRILAGITGQFQ
jgi:hypothetical protein